MIRLNAVRSAFVPTRKRRPFASSISISLRDTAGPAGSASAKEPARDIGLSGAAKAMGTKAQGFGPAAPSSFFQRNSRLGFIP